jgi:hypothetical protein
MPRPHRTSTQASDKTQDNRTLCELMSQNFGKELVGSLSEKLEEGTLQSSL